MCCLHRSTSSLWWSTWMEETWCSTSKTKAASISSEPRKHSNCHFPYWRTCNELLNTVKLWLMFFFFFFLFAHFNLQILCRGDNSGTAVSPLKGNHLQVRSQSRSAPTSAVSARPQLNRYRTPDRICRTGYKSVLYNFPFGFPQRSEAWQRDAGQGRTHQDSRLWHVQRACVWRSPSHHVLWDTRLHRAGG